jgi:hypothetical protein
MSVDSSWGRSAKITIDHTKVTGDQVNFPVGVIWNGTTGNISTAAEVYNASANGPLSTGADIRFTSDSAGNTELAFDIVTYTQNSTVANARVEIWVKLAAVSSASDTSFYIWYKNAGASAYAVGATFGRNAVWSDYFAVWHMNEAAVVDASGNNSNGTNNGTTATTTVLGTARAFLKATPTNITVTGLLGSPSGASVSALFNRTTIDVNGSEIVSLGDCLAIRIIPQLSPFYHYSTNWNGITGTTAPTAGTLYHTTYVCFPGASTEAIYLNATSEATATTAQALNYSGQGANTTIGFHGNGQAQTNFDGTLDEMRIRKTQSTSTWITTEYNAEIGYATFISASAPTDNATTDPGLWLSFTF